LNFVKDENIDGREFDFVAPYDIRECVERLKTLKHERLIALEYRYVDIKPSKSDKRGLDFSIRQSIVTGRRQRANIRIRGNLHAIDNHTTKVHGESPVSNVVMTIQILVSFGILLFLIYLVPSSIWGNSDGSKTIIMGLIVVLIPIVIFGSIRKINVHTEYMLTHLYYTLK